MRRSIPRPVSVTAAALAAALALAGAATAALPRHGALVPGASLGGIHLGETAAQVTRALGRSHGVCRGCARTTWYFTYRPFDRHGLAVELAGGRVTGVYTVWRPAGWRGPGPLVLGAQSAEVTSVTGPLVSIDCSSYRALVADRGPRRSVYYVVNDLLWGFGLFGNGADPCR
jgi:hypothetical protein